MGFWKFLTGNTVDTIGNIATEWIQQDNKSI